MDLKLFTKIMKIMFLAFVGIVGFTLVLVETAYPKWEEDPEPCNNGSWSCDEGSCIEAKLKCNGAVDCPDGSDEAFPLCRNSKCPGFKCVYGGCVASNASCDGVRHCADASDELQLKCRNESTYLECLTNLNIHKPKLERLEDIAQCELKFRTCKNGQELQHYQKCDGKVDCEDGSDETLETCATDQRSCSFFAFGPKFRCKYGGCIYESAVCNGVNDCADGSDELNEICEDQNNDTSKWECDDGSIIGAQLKCNGALDCPDGSDETFLLCRNNVCPLKFRCVYGGCISNSGICNGVQDCADNSDELLTKCRNEMTYKECFDKMRYLHLTDDDSYKKNEFCARQDEKCKNGQTLEFYRYKCDGRVHCEDGSDEELEACATDRHNCILSNKFRCQHGGCIEQSKVCNKIQDCADGSDELDDLCHLGKCVLPEYPEHGNYTVVDEPKAYPGLSLKAVLLVYSCDPGYKPNGKSHYVICSKGKWADKPLQCIAQCNLRKDPSIDYWCRTSSSILSDTMECEEQVPEGTTVVPECSEPDYYYPEGVLPYTSCVNGSWDRSVPTCSPRCGLVTPRGEKLVINGTSAEQGKLPWHAGIYNKLKRPYQQICGGSLISDNIVLSAAHCFWSDVEKLLPAEDYAVGLGKIYRPWNEKYDIYAQKSEVQELLIPSYFHGATTSFQNDIALVVLATRVKYGVHVRPVCLDFSPNFESRQLAVGNSGMVAGWGLTAEDGNASPVLKVATLPYVDIDRCYKESPPSFYAYITYDKFCAGNHNDATLCQGDSGGGLVFSTRERNQERYYLRGVVSTKPQSNHPCNAYAHTTFTQVSKHQEFIQEHWS